MSIEVLDNTTPMNQLIGFLITEQDLTLNKILAKAEQLSRLEYRMICDAFSASYLDEEDYGCAMNYYNYTFLNEKEYPSEVPNGNLQLTLF